MLLDVLIPSNGQLSKLQPLLESISSQTLQPDRVLILIHKIIKKEEQETLLYFLQKSVHPELAEKIFLITNLTAEYEPGHGVGHDRNVLVRHAQAKFVWMIDHDNICKENMFADTAEYWMKIQEQDGMKSLISPTILRRKTVTIQSQGITQLRFFFPKYIYGKMNMEDWQQVKMVGANSLFGLKETFQEHPFDERFSLCYEDVDMTYRVHRSGTRVIVLNKVEINHMEAKKNKLEQRFLGSPHMAYARARNRVLFVKKNATRWQKIEYFGCGLRIQTVGFFGLILLYGGVQRGALLKAVWEGTRDGIS